MSKALHHKNLFSNPLYLVGAVVVSLLLVVSIVVTQDSKQQVSLSTLQPLNDEDIQKALNTLTLEEKQQLTDEQWKVYLPKKSYEVLRLRGTEIPFTGDLLDNKQSGTYVTADCGIPVFRSEHKYNSYTGWPSFWQPINEEAIELVADFSESTERTEVIEPTCNSHLGHLFDDGPDPTGKRFCINSAALKFIPD